jgi:hypothetical protein
MRGPYPGDLRVRVIKLSLWKQEDPDVALPNTLRSARVPRSAGCNAFAKMGRANQCPVEGARPRWRSIRGGFSLLSASNGTLLWMSSFRYCVSGGSLRAAAHCRDSSLAVASPSKN